MNMSFDMNSPNLSDQPRKKIRKGTRSCWECKHRKVRCHFSSDGDRSCRECLARGLSCRSQELPEPENPRESDRLALNERMARVESHLETIAPQIAAILQRLEQSGDARHSLPIRFKTSTPAVTPQETAPALGLFEDETLGFQKPDTGVSDPTPYGTINSDWQTIRRDLMSLIPSPETLELISEASSNWWLMRVQLFEDYEASLLPVPLETLSESHPTVIGKAVLWIALCLQQLPLEYDETLLVQLPYTRAVLIEKCITTVATRVCADDSIVSCIDGLECLVLQGVIFGNNGKIRSAWLSYRRTADIAQIMGLHREIPVAAANAEFRRRATSIWGYILMAERRYSLILGVHGAIPNTAIDLHQPDPKNSEDTPTKRRSALNPLVRIAGSIIERNQTFTKVTEAMIKKTMEVDAELAQITPPALQSPDETPGAGKSRERCMCFLLLHDRLLYYQLKAWLFLPLFLQSSEENPHHAHRKSCLEASRCLIKCYTRIRQLTENGFDSNILDFQAFTAAMTIVIHSVGPFGPGELNQEDLNALESVAAVLERLSKQVPADDVASRGWQVLSTLRAVAMAHDYPALAAPVEGETEKDRPNRIKLHLPYFGTILLEHRTWGDKASISRGENLNNTNIVSTTMPPRPPSPTHAENLPSSWMGTIMDSENTQQQLGPGLGGYWALNTEFTFQPPFLADFDIDWSNCDFGLEV